MSAGIRREVWREGGRRVRTGWCGYDDITPELGAQGVEVVSHRIDVEGFWRYVAETGYRDMSYWDGGRARAGIEKWLEHFVSIELMAPRAGEVFVCEDIATDEIDIEDLVSRLSDMLLSSGFSNPWGDPSSGD